MLWRNLKECKCGNCSHPKPHWDITSHSTGQPVYKNTDRDVEKPECLHIADRTAQWYSCYGIWSFQKKIQPSYDLAILLPDGHKRTESRILKRGLHTQIHSNIIYNRQDVGAKQVSIIRWINKQNMAYTYKGILFGLKKERNSDIHHNMDEPRKHLAKWNKTITNRQLLRTPFTQGMWNSHIRRSRK